jgi:YD repeat-containing protein
MCAGSSCREMGFPQVFVNTANLTLFARVTDLVLGGRAGSLTLEQSFNMDDSRSGLLGLGWAFSLGDNLTVDSDGSLVLRRGTGRIDRFAAAPGASTFTAVTNTKDTLSQVAAGGHRLRSGSSNVTWNFRADGKLASIQDGAAVRVSLNYDAAGRLTAARFRGRTIDFSTDENGRITGISDAAGRAVGFTYSAENRLTGQSNADGSSVTYEYDAAGNLTGLTYAGGKYAVTYAGSAPSPDYPELPVAGTACVLVTRAALDALGGFDATTLGTAAADDFCRRAAAMGWRHLLCDAAFVARLWPDPAPGLDEVPRLLARWPDYHEQVARFLLDDPLRPLRSRLAARVDSLERGGPQRGLFD